jgi:hypothetical protein
MEPIGLGGPGLRVVGDVEMSAVPFVRITTMPTPPSVIDQARAAAAAVAERRRVVAAAVSASELLRTDSDLARALHGFPRADLLLATDEPRLAPVRIVVPAPPGPVDVDDLPPVELDRHAAAEQELELPTSVLIDDLAVPGLVVHRLDLPAPLPAASEDDLVAALSELIGFDPEPGVVCLAPQPVDPGTAVVSAAAQRVAQVYGLPLLRYRHRELLPAGVSGA